MGKERNLPIEQLTKPAEILANHFVQRWDMYPKQMEDGSYITVHEELTRQHLVDHLMGDLTLGSYVLDEGSRGRYLVFDADDEPDWRRLKAVSKAFLEIGSESYLERSRRGGHLWIFFEEKLEGRDLRTFGRGLMGHFGVDSIEMFPKQDALTTGPGSLVRMPFGVHAQVGRRFGFCTAEGEPLAPTIRDQLELLAEPQTVPADIYQRFRSVGSSLEELSRLPSPEPWDHRYPSGTEGEKLSDRIKAAVPVRRFVMPYVELSKSGKGHCPFHDDKVESFSVNDEENYWNCFAGCGGGSIIDFWMKLQDCDYKTAVDELEERLLHPDRE